MTNACDYKRRILVAVTGLAPQILTETLYALVKQEPAFIPTEIHVITTTAGAERIRLQLLSEDPGWFLRLIEELGIPAPAFDSDHIHVITAGDGDTLNDIRSPSENDSMADMIMALMQGLTGDSASAVHASIAGGRKTMGFYLGYAMSLFGRNQDSMSHVLVSPEYEGHFDFFYPTRDSRIIYGRDARQTPLDTRDAHVELANIPFLRLRNAIPGDIRLQRQQSYNDFIDQAQHQFSEPEITLSLSKKALIAEGIEISLPAAYFTWYYLLAREKINADGNASGGYVSGFDTDLKDKILDCYSHVVNENSGTYERVERGLARSKGNFSGYVHEKTSRVRSELVRALLHRAEAYSIVTDASCSPAQYGLEIKPENIHIVD